MSIEIRADGRMLTRDGANVAESRLEVLAAAEEWGFVKIRRTPVHDNGRAGCAAGSRPMHVPVTDLLPYAHGDAFALCGFDNIGGCDNWFSRVPSPGARTSRPARHDLYGAVERGFHALAPENRASFELILTGTPGESPFPDPDSPGGFRTVVCEHSVSVALLHHGSANLQLIASSCSDAALIDSLASKFVNDPAARDELTELAAPEAEKRRFGVGLAEETLDGGAKVYYLSAALHDSDIGVPLMVAVRVDARKTHAIVVSCVNMDIGAQPAEAADNRLMEDPEEFLRALVVRLAKDPDAGR